MSDSGRVTVDEISVNASGERVATLATDGGESIVVPLSRLPNGVRVGDVLTHTFTRDDDARSRRLRRVRDLQRRLFGGR